MEQLLFGRETYWENISIYWRASFPNPGTSDIQFFQKSYFFNKGTSSKEVLFQNSYFFNKGTSSKEVLFQNRYFLEKANFWKRQYSASTIFSGKLLFQSGYLYKRTHFQQQQLFRRATFSQNTFSEEVLFHSYTSFAQLHSLIYQLVIKWARCQLRK